MIRAIDSKKIALCYVLSSSVSCKLQQDSIAEVCEKHGWEARFYLDICKSGHNTMRPELQRLEQGLENPDVAAVVINNLKQLHRSHIHSQIFITKLQKHGIMLVLADHLIDTTTSYAQLMLGIMVMMDEMYAESIAEKARDSIEHRKSRGISIGKPPFGTTRNGDGYLMPTDEGVWLLNDGTWVEGTRNDAKPTNDAQWRGYFECAMRIFELYACGDKGYTRLAYQLNSENWAFKSRTESRPLNAHDVRRVIMSHRVYGGASDTQSDYRIENTIVDIDLLYAVEKQLKERRKKPS